MPHYPLIVGAEIVQNSVQVFFFLKRNSLSTKGSTLSNGFLLRLQAVRHFPLREDVEVIPSVVFISN